MKKLLFTSLLLIWTLSFGIWDFAQSASAAFTNHTLGDENASIHWEIYDDFECPFCQRLHNSIQDPSIQKMIEDGSLKITIKDFPLSFHANGENAAKAANAVGHLAPDKYYDMVDLIFKNLYSWGVDPSKSFADYAEELGVNREAFLKAYSDPRNLEEIKADLSEGSQRGVTGTPSSFINGTPISGAQPLNVFLEAIEKAAGLDIRPVPSNNIYQSFDIEEVNFDEYTQDLGVFWKPTFLTKNTVPIDYLLINYKVHDIKSDIFEYNFKEETRNIFSGSHYVLADRNKKIIITMDAYAADGVFIGSDNITTYTSVNSNNITAPINFEDNIVTKPLENPFFDIDLSTALGAAAKELYELGIIGGFPDSSFREDQAVNRAEAAKFLLLASKQGPESEAYDNDFLDVIDSEWYGPYVLKAANLKIIEGFADNSFRPGAKIQRDQFLAMFARSFNVPTGLAHDFQDKGINPDAWYWDYAGIATKYDLFPGEKSLRPEQTMTRGEVALAIWQYLKTQR